MWAVLRHRTWAAPGSPEHSAGALQLGRGQKKALLLGRGRRPCWTQTDQGPAPGRGLPLHKTHHPPSQRLLGEKRVTEDPHPPVLGTQGLPQLRLSPLCPPAACDPQGAHSPPQGGEGRDHSEGRCTGRAEHGATEAGLPRRQPVHTQPPAQLPVSPTGPHRGSRGRHAGSQVLPMFPCVSPRTQKCNTRGRNTRKENPEESKRSSQN